MTEPAEPDFEVIVIGAGIGGCVAAYQLARQGRSVLLIERGEAPGSKNLSGGVLYSRGIQQVFPDFLAEAPVERRITRNYINFLNGDSSVAIHGDEVVVVNAVFGDIAEETVAVSGPVALLLDGGPMPPAESTGAPIEEVSVPPLGLKVIETRTHGFDAVDLGAAHEGLVGVDPAEPQVEVVLPRVADAAVALDRLAR